MTASRVLFSERPGGWLIGRNGGIVVQLIVDYAVTLVIHTDEGDIEVRIESPFVWAYPSGDERLLVPDSDPKGLSPVLAIARQEIQRIAAYKDGHLEIPLADGARLLVPPEEGGEAWGITGPAGLRLVCTPGGEVAVWSPQS